MALCVRLVEDNPDLVMLITRVLEPYVKKVELTVTDSNFTTLLDRESWYGVDVALIDVLLGEPDLDGRDILAWLKEERPDIRRVVLSAVGNVFPELGELAHVVLTKGGVSTLTILAAIGLDPDD